MLLKNSYYKDNPTKEQRSKREGYEITREKKLIRKLEQAIQRGRGRKEENY